MLPVPRTCLDRSRWVAPGLKRDFPPTTLAQIEARAPGKSPMGIVRSSVCDVVALSTWLGTICTAFCQVLGSRLRDRSSDSFWIKAEQIPSASRGLLVWGPTTKNRPATVFAKGFISVPSGSGSGHAAPAVRQSIGRGRRFALSPGLSGRALHRAHRLFLVSCVFRGRDLKLRPVV